MGGKTRIVEHENAGNAVVSEFGDCKNKPFVIFTGHLDTVFDDPETTKKRPFTIKDGTAYGPGVLDMKGLLVIGFEQREGLLAGQVALHGTFLLGSCALSALWLSYHPRPGRSSPHGFFAGMA